MEQRNFPWVYVSNILINSFMKCLDFASALEWKCKSYEENYLRLRIRGKNVIVQSSQRRRT